MKHCKIAVAGNQWITSYLIHKLCDAGFKPDLVINMSPAHAEKISGYVDLTEVAQKYSIDVYRPTLYSLKSDDDIACMAEYEIDVLLVFGWQRLIPEWLIDRCKMGVYGVHGGPELPPRCRGRAVFNWAIIMGYTRFYLYLFKITPEVDSGNIVELREFDINDFDDILTIYHKNCVSTTQMIISNLPAVLDGTVKLSPQADEEPTYLPKRTPEDGEIYWNQPAKNICNLVRAVTKPYPGAFSNFNGHTVWIYRAHIFDEKIKFIGQTGEIVEVFENGDFIVLASDYPIYVSQYETDDGSVVYQRGRFTFDEQKQIRFPSI